MFFGYPMISHISYRFCWSATVSFCFLHLSLSQLFQLSRPGSCLWKPQPGGSRLLHVCPPQDTTATARIWRTRRSSKQSTDQKKNTHRAVCQNLIPLVNIKIAGKWMFIPLKNGINRYWSIPILFLVGPRIGSFCEIGMLMYVVFAHEEAMKKHLYPSPLFQSPEWLSGELPSGDVPTVCELEAMAHR